MNKDKLIFKDGTVIELEAGAGLGGMMTVCESKEDVLQVWAKLTDDNLEEVAVQTGEGLTVGRYTDLILVKPHITATECLDGSIEVVFGLRQKTDGELRLEALEKGQEIQDGAISDLGDVVGGMAEQMEGVKA